MKNKENIKITNKELNLLISLLGTKKTKHLYIEGKIKLTNKQLEYLINYEE